METPVGLRWTGHALIDMGVAAVVLATGNERPAEVTQRQWEQWMNELEQDYQNKYLQKPCSILFTLNAFDNPSWSKKPAERAQKITRTFESARQAVPPLAETCTFFPERPAVVRAARDLFPMLMGQQQLNFYPNGRSELPLSALALGCVLSLPRVAPIVSGRAMIVGADDPELLLDLCEYWKEALDRELALLRAGGTWMQADAALYARFCRHRLFLKEGRLSDDPILEEIVRRVQEGEAVLVVTNLVVAAQQLAGALAKRLGSPWPQQCDPAHDPVLLVHSRFTAEDRLQREAILQDRVDDRSRKQGFVVVATQVVEVSLDVDFDTIYTDPAPLEALVQRFGRVNRRRRHRERPVFVMREAMDWTWPYRQEALMRRTVAHLAQFDGELIDEATISQWLDAVYEPEIPGLLEQVARGRRSYEEVAGPERLIAFESDPGLEDQFDALFDGYEVLPLPLQEEFLRRIEKGAYVEAYGLLVPVSRGRFHAFRQQHALTRLQEYRVWVADCGYDACLGLQPDVSEITACMI